MSSGPCGTSSAPDTGAWGGWDEARERAYCKGLALTPEQRLSLLEEMILFAAHCGALPRPRPADPE